MSEKKTYENIKETYIKKELNNGLTLIMIPKEEYKQITVSYGVNLGGTNEAFLDVDNNINNIPSGTAHFLEHKMFEMNGYDALQRFSEIGADSNAFTNEVSTVYYFKTVTNVKENISLLLEMVQNPLFTKETIEKEKQIIEQEINMYYDDPFSRLFNGFLKTLYPKQPLEHDIAGTVKSISKIDLNLLLKIHRYFYQPSNSFLKIVGNFDVKEMENFVEKIQENNVEDKLNFTPLNYFNNDINPNKNSSEEMPVNNRITMFGFKISNDVLESVSDEETIKEIFSIKILLEIIFGEGSKWFNENFLKGIIDDSFSFDIEYEKNYVYIYFVTNNSSDKILIDEVENILKQENLFYSIDQNEFEREKKSFLGTMIANLDSLENLSLDTSEQIFKDVNVFDQINIVKKIKWEKLNEVFLNYLFNKKITSFTVKPKK